MLAALQQNDQVGDASYEKLLAEAARYGVPADRAAVLLADFQKTRFRAMVRRVAHGHIVSEAQSRILLPKAAAYGLDQANAFEIISDYTLSVMTPDDILAGLSMAETFDQEEIEEFDESRSDQPPAIAPVRARLGRRMPQWLSLGVLVLAAGGALFLLAKWIGTRKPDRGVAVLPPDAQPRPTAAPAATGAPPEPTLMPIEQWKPAFDFRNLPDPVSGFPRAGAAKARRPAPVRDSAERGHLRDVCPIRPRHAWPRRRPGGRPAAWCRPGPTSFR